VQPEPACVTLNVLPATMMVALREALAVFAAMVNVAVPFPVPLLVLSVIHDAVVLACHAHPLLVVTEMLPAAPPAENVWLVGAMV
jgi:hypothetical protein